MKIINSVFFILIFLLLFFVSYQIINTKKELININEQIEKLEEENKNLKLEKENILKEKSVKEIIKNTNYEDIGQDDLLIIDRK